MSQWVTLPYSYTEHYNIMIGQIADTVSTEATGIHKRDLSSFYCNAGSNTDYCTIGY